WEWPGGRSAAPAPAHRATDRPRLATLADGTTSGISSLPNGKARAKQTMSNAFRSLRKPLGRAYAIMPTDSACPADRQGVAMTLLRTAAPKMCAGPAGSIVAVDTFSPLVPLLRLERQGGDRSGVEALQRDRLSGFLAKAIGAVLDPRQS